MAAGAWVHWGSGNPPVTGPQQPVATCPWAGPRSGHGPAEAHVSQAIQGLSARGGPGECSVGPGGRKRTMEPWGSARSCMQLPDVQCARIRSGGSGATPGGAEGLGDKGEKDGAGCRKPSWNRGGRQGRAVWVSHCPTVRRGLLNTGRNELELTEITESEGQKDLLGW